MTAGTGSEDTKILILATLSGGYAGANSVGQIHASYAPNTYVLPVASPAMFPENFYLRAFERGIDAILVMYSGTDSPFKGDSDRTAQIINRVYPLMTARGIDTRRLRLVAICTVCTAAFQREIRQINDVLAEIGPVRAELKVAER
jgi:coenzyme F420-reducing hydrogenase delta subunit